MILLILIFSSINLFSEDSTDSSRIEYGAFLDYTLNLHNADFQKIPDCESCSPGYRNGSGYGVAFGLIFEYPITSYLNIGSRLLYNDYSSLLTAKESIMLSIDNKPIVGEIEHSLDVKLSSVGIEPFLKYKVSKALSLIAGSHISSVIKREYSQKEEITKPAGFGTFVDENGIDTRSRIRNEFSGELKFAADYRFALFGGVAYQLPLNKQRTLLAEPELIFLYGFNRLVYSDLINYWTANSLRAGLSIKYAPEPSKEIIQKFEYNDYIDTLKIKVKGLIKDELITGIPNIKQNVIEKKRERLTITDTYRTDTLKIPDPYLLSCDVMAYGIDSTGNEIENPKIIVEEFISRKLNPLLNMVFFEENSSEIPTRYTRITPKDAKWFHEDSLYFNSTLEIYHHILNIVGRRMIRNPFAQITLVGCNSDIGSEKGNIAISKLRAESVRDYLVDIWGISDSRIEIKYRNLPQVSSIPTNENDKIQENRRVEIISDDYSIVEPVFLDFIEKRINPPLLRFKTILNAEAGVHNWTLNVSHPSYDLRDRISISKNSDVPESIDVILDNNYRLIPANESPLTYQLFVTDSTGNSIETPKKDIPVEIISMIEKSQENIDNYSTDKYSLILFGFDKADLGIEHKKIIHFIKNRLIPKSEITILGYTDRTGNKEHNQILATERANMTMSEFIQLDNIVTSNNSDVLLYDNDLPEGRFYCRTVEIIVKTKIE
jgi:outer membrane protein OmpA-like peptidoglycan-associated protein